MNGPYKMKKMMDLGNPTGNPPVGPFKRDYKYANLNGDDKKRFEANIDAMNEILLGIPNDIYNSVDACKTAQAMWQQFQGYAINDDPTDSLSTTMMLLAKAITQHYSTPTNNRLRVSSNTRNQAYVQDGRIDIESKNVGNTGRVTGNSGYIGNTGRVAGNSGYVSNTRRVARNSGNSGNAQRVTGNNAMVQRIPKTSTNAWNTSMNDEAGITLTKEENDFLLADVNGEEELKELNASCIMMARIQTVNNDYDAEPSYDFDFANEKHVESESLMRNVQLEAEKTKEEIKTVKDANALLKTKL
ncbi:hypothetical protein Tco_0294418 [Tanacetum coccineum]